MGEKAVIRAYAVTLFLILALCYGYIMPKQGDWGANSRAALVYAVADQGVLTIDAYHGMTGDKAFFEGHYYSEKSIGPSLLALPFYVVYRNIAGLPPVENLLRRLIGDDESAALGGDLARRPPPGSLVVITFAGSGLPSAILGVVLFLFATRFTGRPGYAFLLALAYGLATVAFPQSTVFYQHQLAALGAFGAFFLLWRVIFEAAGDRWLWLAGVLFGLTLITEYPAALALGALFLWAAYHLRGRRLMLVIRLALGALPLCLLFAVYNVLIFGTPLPVAYNYSVSWGALNRLGFMGISGFALDHLYGITLSPFRGLFFLSPFLLLALPGLCLMWQRREQRSTVVLLVIIIAAFFLYNASYIVWWGAHSVGPRYLSPMVPFLALPVIHAFDRWLPDVRLRWFLILLLALSFFNTWAQTLAGVSLPELIPDPIPANADPIAWYLQQLATGNIIDNPLFEYAIPLLARGDINRNYGLALGLPGLFSLLPLLAAALALALILPRWLARKGASA